MDLNQPVTKGMSLAMGIIGGLVSATLLTLMVLPTLYLVIERRANRLASPPAQR
jgi:Cu/Ag efflux pump CusA